MGENLVGARVTFGGQVVAMVRDGKGTEIWMSIGDEASKNASLYISAQWIISQSFSMEIAYIGNRDEF